MAFVATSLEGPPFHGLIVFLKLIRTTGLHLQLGFFKQLDLVTAQNKAQAAVQNAQINTHESISFYACRVEDLVKKS